MSLQKIAWLFLTTMMVISFQNCGKPFHSISQASSASTSAQCTAKFRLEAASYKLSSADLNCADFNNYACDQRIFSPDVPDLTESVKECVGTGTSCVDVDVRQYNTSGARTNSYADPAAFLPGGEYNYEEIHCYHRMVYQGIALFEAQGNSLEEALAGAMAACEQAVAK